jgi:phosphoribosylamine-glycine ligase
LGPRCRCLRCVTAGAVCCSALLKTSNASATVTPAPTPVGWGAFSPYLPEGDLAAGELERIVADDFIAPTLAALRGRGIDFRGVLYAGLMLTSDGPKLLEYNVRFGDPETQVVLPRMTSSLVELLAQAAAGSIEAQPTFSDEAMVNVVCASEGYPASPRTGGSHRWARRRPGPARGQRVWRRCGQRR